MLEHTFDTVGSGVGTATALLATSTPRPLWPVTGSLGELMPQGGFRAGTTVTVSGSRAVLHTVLSTATSRGRWAAMCGFSDIGVLAALAADVAIERLISVPDLGDRPAVVASALLDGVDTVIVRADLQQRWTPAQARQLSLRARNRGALLIPFGSAWPGPVDLHIAADHSVWEGLGRGYGYLSHHSTVVTVTGRGAASRPRSGQICLFQDDDAAQSWGAA